MLCFLIFNKVYSPQQVLWLVPLVMLARPKLADWGTWVVAELIYWAAVWGHLGTMSSPGDGGPDVVYWAAIGFRIVVLVWLCAQVSHDMRHPWDDPVRTPQVDDPIGGILDHAPERPVSDDFRDDDRDEAVGVAGFRIVQEALTNASNTHTAAPPPCTYTMA